MRGRRQQDKFFAFSSPADSGYGWGLIMKFHECISCELRYRAACDAQAARSPLSHCFGVRRHLPRRGAGNPAEAGGWRPRCTSPSSSQRGKASSAEPPAGIAFRWVAGAFSSETVKPRHCLNRWFIADAGLLSRALAISGDDLSHREGSVARSWEQRTLSARKQCYA